MASRAPVPHWSATYEPVPLDPLQDANRRFQADKDPEKVNLGIGTIMDYRTGQAWMSPTLQATYRRVAGLMPGYLTSKGLPSYVNRHAQQMVFGEEVWAEVKDHTVAVQTLGGTKALDLAATILSRKLPAESRKLYGDGQWANHPRIFADFEQTFPIHEDPVTREYLHDDFAEGLRAHPDGAPVLLQAGGHNPTGTDRTKEQWTEIAEIIKEKGCDVIFDFPYNGLVNGMGSDNFPIQLFVKMGIVCLVAVSNSKNGCYEAKLGSLYITPIEKSAVPVFQSNIEEAILRPDYSNPPRSIAAALAIVLGDRELAAAYDQLILQRGETAITADAPLTQQYFAEIEAARQQIDATRDQLADCLDAPWLKSKGGIYFMAQGTPFGDEQLAYLRGEHIHPAPDSRINIGGVPADRVAEVAEKLKRALTLTA